MDIEKLISAIEDADEVEIMEFDFNDVFTALREIPELKGWKDIAESRQCVIRDLLDNGVTHGKEISNLKQKNINMRKECNKRYSEQLQKIRKLEAEKMLQIQSKLFEDTE